MGANDRIRIGIIGLGGPGCSSGFQAHERQIVAHARENNTAVGAVCDVYRPIREVAQHFLKLKDSDAFVDYRKLLERKDIDAVIVATHDPWHAQMCIDAVDAGKHVYCELPLTRYLDEAFRVYDRVKSSKTVFQAGAVGCSADGWRKAAELLTAGKIGEPISGHTSYCRNNPRGEWNYVIPPEAVAQNIDWEAWLGPVRKRIPFSAEHVYRWKKYYAYSCGPLGSLGSMRLLPLLVAYGRQEFPVRVNCVSTHTIHTDGDNFPDRDVPEHVQLQAEFPSGFTIHLTCSTVSAASPGIAIYGQKGVIKLGASGESVELIPEKEFANEAAPEKHEHLPVEDFAAHHKDWFDCIRSGRQPKANIELALRVQTIVSLGEMSERLRMTCNYDPAQRRITDSTGREVRPLGYDS